MIGVNGGKRESLGTKRIGCVRDICNRVSVSVLVDIFLGVPFFSVANIFPLSSQRTLCSAPVLSLSHGFHHCERGKRERFSVR